MQMNENYPVTVMNFSRIYEDQKFYRTPLQGITPRLLDFTDLRGTNGFCDAEAAAEIRRRIAALPLRGVHFLDNGNYHYLTRFWCEKITEDFVLLIYDHHLDLRKPAFPGLMSCGSWIRDILLRNTHCRGILIVGASRAQAAIINPELSTLSSEVIPPEELERMMADERLAAADHHTRVKEYVKTKKNLQDPILNVSLYCFTEEDILNGRADNHIPPLLERIRLPLYISIDKDVLSRKVLRTNWDQGVMTEQELRRELRFFVMSPAIRILGMDICGEPAYNSYRRILDDTRDIRRSDGFNRRLLELFVERPDPISFMRSMS